MLLRKIQVPSSSIPTASMFASFRVLLLFLVPRNLHGVIFRFISCILISFILNMFFFSHVLFYFYLFRFHVNSYVFRDHLIIVPVIAVVVIYNFTRYIIQYCSHCFIWNISDILNILISIPCPITKLEMNRFFLMDITNIRIKRFRQLLKMSNLVFSLKLQLALKKKKRKTKHIVCTFTKSNT